MSYQSTILADNPVAYYRLNEFGGTAVYDSSGDGLNGTVSSTGIALNQPGALLGDPDTAMLFNGSSGRITLPLSTNHVANLSLECWVNIPDALGQGVAIQLGYASGFGIGIGGTTWDNAGANIIGVVYGYAWLATGIPLSVNTWHHIVMTFGTIPSASILIYLDGSLVSTLTTPGYITPATGTYLGNDPDGFGGRWFHGLIDEVAIYTHVLTPAQILAHHGAGTSITPLVIPSPKGVTVTIGGVDVTQHIEESSIDIIDALGQGAGTGAASAGRAATATLYADYTLGSMYNSVGAGTSISSPKLVRGGEVRIYDFTGTCVFGGFATKHTDLTKYKTLKTQIDCIDYFQHLDNIYVNEVFDGNSDIYIIKFLLSKYAPWVNQSLLPSFSTYIFTAFRLRNISLQKAIGKITDTTGFQTWIGTDKKMRYENPATAQSAPFSLSNVPDFQTKFPRTLVKYEIDDNAIINRVYFFGGKKPSIDQHQDLSNQANGVNTVFVLPYYPHVSSDGKYHLTVNGVTQAVGFALGTKVSDKLISAGGTANVILDSDAKTLTFDVAPPVSATVSIIYSYQLPMVVVVTDEGSHRYFGAYYDAIISDETIFDTPRATQRCRILLLEQAYGLTTIPVTCWKAGLKSGQLLKLQDTFRGISNTYIIQKVETKSIGNGSFEFTVDLGAWNWNMVDVMKNAAFFATSQDTSTDENTTVAIVEQTNENVKTTLTISRRVANFGGYHAHSTALGDGADAYSGFASITT